MPLVDIIAGARPNFVKIAPVINALQSNEINNALKFRLIHTGQHYDQSMSKDFFAQLNIPAPDHNLSVGSGSQAEQTANIMLKYEQLLLENACDYCLVFGDVNSTIAAALTAKKLNLLVGHVEAGIRSGDRFMPEEINRLATDAISDHFFTTSREASSNLESEGASAEVIHFVGNVMIDTLLKNQSRFSAPQFWETFKFKKKRYVLLTMHRPENVDRKLVLSKLLTAISMAAEMPIIFPAHPRTKQVLETIGKIPENIFVVSPQAYLEFGFLVKYAALIITDSGGVTEEATVLNVPCITLRETTERPETVNVGTNILVGRDIEQLRTFIGKASHGDWKTGGIPEKWDGKSGMRIAKLLESKLV